MQDYFWENNIKKIRRLSTGDFHKDLKKVLNFSQDLIHTTKQARQEEREKEQLEQENIKIHFKYLCDLYQVTDDNFEFLYNEVINNEELYKKVINGEDVVYDLLVTHGQPL